MSKIIFICMLKCMLNIFLIFLTAAKGAITLNYYYPPLLYQREEKRNIVKIGLALLIIMIVPTVFQFAATAIACKLSPQAANSAGFDFFLVFVPQYLLAYPLAVVVLRRLPQHCIPQRSLGVNPFFHYFCICYLALTVGSLLNAIFNRILQFFCQINPDFSLSELLNQFNLPTVFLLTVLLAPLAEELIFRKMLLDRLIKYGELPAVITSGLVFGLCHGSFSQFFYAVLVGWIFAYIYVKTGKIRYSICLHMIINFWGSVMPMTINQNLNHLLFVIYITTSLAFIILGVIYCIPYRKKTNFAPSDFELNTKEALKIIWLNWGMILAVLVCFVFFAANIIL